MTTRPSFISLLCIMVLLHFPLSAQVPLTQNDFTHHQDAENGFFVTYPKSWARVPTTHGVTKLKILSENGAGSDDFSVVVISDPAFAKITPDRLVTMSVERPDAMLRMAARDFPDAKLVKSGRTKLNNQDAFYLVYDATFRSPGLDVPMRFYQVSTVRSGRAYYLTCRSAPEDFEKLYPVFTVIMANFRFLP